MSMLIEGISVVLRSCRNDHVLAAYALEEEDSGGYVDFVSSRRRHTILQCDWSSDVCSSDLRPGGASSYVRASWGRSRGAFMELDYKQLKGELGLDHYEGRSWLGWYHHTAMVTAAHGFLTLERQHPNHQRPA